MIVDASVAFKWIFHEEGSGEAAALLGRNDLVAPILLLTEIGNALWKKGRRGELSDQDTYATQLAMVASLVVTMDEGDVVPIALDMALLLDHAIYDCIYLALAARLGDMVITADEKLVRKVDRSPHAGLVQLL